MSLAASLTDPQLFADKLFCNGSWVASRGGATFDVTNPATGAVIGAVPESGAEDLDEAVAAASAALPAWRALSGRQRGRVLRATGEMLAAHRGDVGRIITAENGKARGDAEGEVAFAASFFEWFGEEAARVYGTVIPHSAAGAGFRAAAVREPVGVCGLVTPWNFPLAMAARKVAAALAAGCTAVLKPDGLTPFAALALARAAELSGLPSGVLNVVTASPGATPAIGLRLCEHPVVRKISFTGSTAVGRLLMRQSAATLKKLSLELGGNAPFIVFDDAVDIDAAVAACVAAKFKVAGQTCVCANRIYVQRGVYDGFAERLAAAVARFRVGDASADAGADGGEGGEAVTHGPLTTGVAKVEAHVRDAVAKGAKVLAGGHRLEGLGSDNFFAPTVLTGCDASMRVAAEETFGPVAALIPFDTEDEVVAAANAVDVGLASYVMTGDLARSHRVTERLDYGMVAINTGVISDAPAPFGGVKQSGMGREGSKYGLDDYLVIKTVITGGINTVHANL